MDAEQTPRVVVPREAATRRLLELDGRGRLTRRDVELAAAGLAVSPRTVWRWLQQARRTGEPAGRIACRMVKRTNFRC